MIDSVIFIGSVIAAIVELIKYYVPRVSGPYTILVAALVGLVVSLIDTAIGVTNISVAQGILTGLATAGVVAGAAKAGGRATTPVVEPTTRPRTDTV